MKPVRCRSIILSLTSSHCSLVLPVMMMKLTLCTGVLYIHNNLGSEIYGIDCATWAHSHSVENRIMTSLFHSMNANQFIAFMDYVFSGCMSDTLPLFIKMRDCSYLQKSENLQIQGSNNYSFQCMFEIDLDFTGSTMFVTDTDVVYFHQTQSKKANHRTVSLRLCIHFLCIHTPPIISKCSCLLKSIALPLKNHLKMGLRDESLDTSQGNTMLCPTLASKLKGGTMIFVGSWGEKHIDVLLYAARCR